MQHFDPSFMARLIVEDRIRDARQHRIVRRLRRPERVETAAPTAAPTPQRHLGLWSLVPFRHAHG